VSRRLLLGIAAAGTLLAACAAVLWIALPDPSPRLAATETPSIDVVDRYGGLLRDLPAADGTRYRPVALGSASPYLLQAVVAAEDRRFFTHHGVDPLALARAAWQNLRAHRVVSGGSTLTMQLARALEPRPRGFLAKIAQALLALRLEARRGKDEILAAYLSRVPMGNRITGCEAAAHAYLGKPASQLSPAEAALLAAIPRSPSLANPWKAPETLRRRRDRILARMAVLGFLEDASYRAALEEPLVLARDPFRTHAPHFLARVLDQAGDFPARTARIVTALEPELQSRVEVIARRRLAELAVHGVGQMAVAVLDVRQGEWIAIEGSGIAPDLPGGAIDGTRAPRQPGSALKPFTYAAAFERGFTPATVLPDLPHAFVSAGGTWIPKNYDERFHGPLLARTALACSVNVPAAFLLDRIGPAALLDTLRRAGISTLDRGPDHYGLGLTLGAGEVRLDELVLAYAALLRGGEWREASAWRAVLDASGTVLRRPPSVVPRRVCSPESAAEVVDILSDPDARAPAFGAWSVLRLPFPAAVKTGTSEGFRDNWCVGGNEEVAVGVWCGNFDRTAMGNVSGIAGAGSVWREVMLAWAEVRHPEGGAGLAPAREFPAGMERARVCALSGGMPSGACPRTVLELFRKGKAPTRRCGWHVLRPDGSTVVRYPALYRAWAAGEGLLDPVSDDAAASEPRAEASLHEIDPTGGAPIAILSPSDGDAFMVVPDLPRAYQSLELRCSVRKAPKEVVWIVDGREVARSQPPYSSRWVLAPGAHRIQAVAAGLRSRAVAITVYGG
jgi:penicillin-binding protein 1C